MKLHFHVRRLLYFKSQRKLIRCFENVIITAILKKLQKKRNNYNIILNHNEN